MGVVVRNRPQHRPRHPPAKPRQPAATPTPPPASGNGAPAPSTGAGVVAPAPTATPATKAVAVINASILNVRRAPAADGEVAQTVNQGERYDVIGRSQDGAWIQIGADGREIGWVAAEFVLQETETVVASPAAPADQSAQPEAQSTTAPAVGGGNYLPATMRSPDFGGQAFLWWRPEIADRDLVLMKEAGFEWVKQAFAWETIEGAGKGEFDWSVADRVVSHVNADGLKLLARLSSDPELTDFWAGAPPGNADNFADFAYAVANRYNCTPQAVGCIQAYQIWNEPNLSA